MKRIISLYLFMVPEAVSKASGFDISVHVFVRDANVSTLSFFLGKTINSYSFRNHLAPLLLVLSKGPTQ